EPPDLREIDDRVEAAVDLAPPHAEDRAAEVDVLAPAQLRVEAGSDLEQRADAAVDPSAAGRRLGDAREDLQQRALAGTVPADDPDDLAGPDVEREVAQRPDRRVFALRLGRRPVAERRGDTPGHPARARRQRVPEGRAADRAVGEPVLLR